MAVNDGRRKDDIEETNFIQSFYQMKQAASQQVLFLSDATASLGKGLRKSIKCYKNEAKDLARSINECLDVDDALKTIHEVIYPEEHALRKSSIVHTPIDWSKYPPSAFRKFSHEHSATIREESEEEFDEDINHEEKDSVLRATIHKNYPSDRSLNHSTNIRSSHLDSIDEKRSLFCHTDVDKRTKSLDNPQIVEPKTISNKRRTQSVSSYPIDTPKKDNIAKKNSLQMNTIRTSKDYRCPSPRPSRKETKRDSASSDDHKIAREEVLQELDKAKDDGDIQRNNLQAESIKTTKDYRSPSPRPSRKEKRKDSAFSDDHKEINEEAIKELDKINDNSDVQINSLQVRSTKISKFYRCPSPRPFRKAIKKDQKLLNDDIGVDKEVQEQLDEAKDDGDVQKDSLLVKSNVISKDYRCPSPRPFRKEVGKGSTSSDDHKSDNEELERHLDKAKDGGDVQRNSLQVKSIKTSRALRCLSPRPSRKELIKNSSPSYNDETVDEEIRNQLDKAKDGNDVQKNRPQVNCSKSGRDYRCPSPTPSKREMRKTSNLFESNKSTDEKVR